MNIYELPEETQRALDLYLACFDPETGEQVAGDEETAHHYAKFQECENQQGQAAEWVLKTRANAEARIAALAFEADRLKAQAARESRTVERMDALVSRFFPADSTEKPVVVSNWTVSYRKSEAVEIDDATAIPAEFMRQPKVPDPAPDKTAIKAALKEGKEVPGARIEERKNLQIK